MRARGLAAILRRPGRNGARSKSKVHGSAVRRGRRRQRDISAFRHHTDDGGTDFQRVANSQLAGIGTELLSIDERSVRAREIGDADARIARLLEQAVVAGELLVRQLHVV